MAVALLHIAATIGQITERSTFRTQVRDVVFGSKCPIVGFARNESGLCIYAREDAVNCRKPYFDGATGGLESC